GGSADTDVLDSQKSQVRHYNTLQEMYKAKKANKAAVSHLLNLEFDSRRCFITSDVLKDDDRPSTFFDVYPCFKEFDHANVERIIQPKNSNYTAETRDRWENFFSKVKFYGVMKKAMKPPKTLNSGK
ncbi:hypothetical protein NL108_015126, partial [Boleophthalmus pectinirostris]